jgi:hypothetical protein
MGNVRARYLGQLEDIDAALAASLDIEPGADLAPIQWAAYRQAAGDRQRAAMGIKVRLVRTGGRPTRRRVWLARALTAGWIALVLGAVGWVQQHEIARIVRDLAP